MYIIIGICAAVVVAALVLCLTLQNCGGQDPADIPVVEQGDGENAPSFNDPGVTSEGDLIIDDGSAPVSEFDVTVTGADGIYRRTGENTSAASLTVTGQNSESFSFELDLSGTGLNGTAYFISERDALCEKSGGELTFTFADGGISLAVTGTVSELGGASADGVYAFSEAITTTAPTTTTTTAANGSSAVYDLDAINSSEVQSALKSIMSESDYTLTNELLGMQGGYGIIYGTGDASLEIKGRSFNLDDQMNAVMYYSFESGTGREVVILCSLTGKVYAGICDGSEYRYYTNDSSRAGAADAPNYIAQYAKIRGMTLVGQ